MAPSPLPAALSARAAGAALVTALLIALWVVLGHCQRYLEFTLAFPGTSWVHLYPSRGGGAGHLKYKGVRIESSGRPAAVRIPLLPVPMDALLLRVDDPGGAMSVRDMRVVNGRGELLARFDRDQVENSGASTVRETEGGVILTPTGLSPIIDLRLTPDRPFPAVPAGAAPLFLKTFLIALAAVAFPLAGILALVRRRWPAAAAGRPRGGTDDSPPTLPALAGMFLIILGSRLWLVQGFGSALPFWDQWGAEATYLYLPHIRGTLTIGDLFAPHNEHHIFLTRIVSLGLLLLNGTWDPLLQMTLNALLYAGVGAFLLRALSTPAHLTWGVAVALLFSLPFGWQNTLGGFQLQMYLMIGLSLLFLWCMTCAPSPRWRWLGGGSCAVLLLFTMASGFLACTAFLGAALLHACTAGGRGRFGQMLPALALCLGVTVAGLLLKVTVPSHHALQAETASGFTLAFASYLGWPLSLFPVLGSGLPGAGALFPAALLLWLPFLLLLRRFMAERDPSPRMVLLVATGIWVVLQVAAAAYARGSNIFPSSRYQDYFAIGILVNLSSLLALGYTPKPAGWRVSCLLPLLWTMGIGAGLLLVTGMNAVHDLPEKRAQQAAGVEHVRRFLTTGDSGALTGKPRYDIPHHDAATLARLLADDDIRRILPPSVGGSAGPGRFKPLLDTLLASGAFIAAAGAILLAGTALRRRGDAGGGS